MSDRKTVFSARIEGTGPELTGDPLASSRRLRVILGLAAGIAAVIAFLPVLSNGWVVFDDDENFLDNVDFRGLGWPQVSWAWTTFKLGVYQPLAWMLLELEYSLFGLNPRGYHLTSLMLHSVVTVAFYFLITRVLFRLLSPTTPGQRAAILGASSLAAAIFAVHPLRVEVVAWASCQPYLPCALFSLLAVIAYLRAFDREEGTRAGWLVAAWLLFLAAQLSKAVAVMLPVVLVVIDIAVLQRVGPDNWAGPSARRVWREKIPFFALSVIFLVLAILAKRSNDALISIQYYGLAARIAQSCYGIVFYLAKTVWPVGLAAYYPLPQPRSRLMAPPFILGIPAVLLTTSVAAFLWRRRPALLATWAAYLIILAPNMGLMRIGNQIAADRYSYVASMPLFVLIAAGLYRLTRWARRGRRRPIVIACLGTAIVLLIGGLSWRLCAAWRDTGALWANNYRQGYVNSTVLFNLGMVEETRGNLERAKEYYLAALRSDPQCCDAHNLLGAVLDREGRREEAMAHYIDALRIEPEYPAAQNNLGSALARQGQLDQAIARFAEAVRLKPEFAVARKNLAKALARTGRVRKALPEYHEAARLAPNDATVRNDYGRVLAQAGQLDLAMARFAEAAKLDPRSAATHINWGLALEESGRFEESATHFAEAVRLEPNRVDNRLLFASALVRQGKTREALPELEAALQLDPGNREALEMLREARAKSHP
jgi:tetratricopeptide (TPR) repeat protein